MKKTLKLSNPKIYSPIAQIALHNSLFIDVIISMNDQNNSPTQTRSSSPNLFNSTCDSLSCPCLTTSQETLTEKTTLLQELTTNVFLQRQALQSWITASTQEVINLRNQTNQTIYRAQPLLDDSSLSLSSRLNLMMQLYEITNLTWKILQTASQWKTSLPQDLREALLASRVLLPTVTQNGESISSAISQD